MILVASLSQPYTHVHVVSKGFVTTGIVVEVLAGRVIMIVLQELFKDTLLLHHLPHGLELFQGNSVWDEELDAESKRQL